MEKFLLELQEYLLEKMNKIFQPNMTKMEI